MRYCYESLTEILIDFEVVIMFKVGHDCLLSVENAGIAHRSGQAVGFRKCALTSLKIFQAQATDVSGEVVKLADSIVGVSVESTDKAVVMIVTCHVAKQAIVEGRLEFASNIIPTS